MDILKTKKSVSRRCHSQLMAASKPLARGTNDKDVYSLEFDGASKGNPGRAGAGAILKRPDGTVLCQLTKGVGIATCNFAEYRALILGLQAALDQGIHHIKAQGDSKLVCNQVMGKWQVRSDNLSTSFAKTLELKKRFQSFSIKHVYRESNSAADALANSAVLLPENEPVSCCNPSLDQQTTMIKSGRPRKGSAKYKGVEDPGVATEACKLIELSYISEKDKKKFYRMDYHGASSRKDGEAFVKALLYTPDGSLIFELRKRLGVATGNVARYQALVIGLRAALECNVSHINVQGDALLVFKQMTGQLKVKEQRLVALWNEANLLLTSFTDFTVTHVDKCQNHASCALAKVAVDSVGNDNIVDAPKMSGKPSMGGCVGVQSQNNLTGKSTLNEITRPLDPLSVAKMNVPAVAYSQQNYRPCRLIYCTLYCQTSQVLRVRPTHFLTFTAVMSKCLSPLYATSMHKVALFLPSKRLRCIPHIFQSSVMHILGGVRRSAGGF